LKTAQNAAKNSAPSLNATPPLVLVARALTSPLAVAVRVA
jgi:hypothetical protein